MMTSAQWPTRRQRGFTLVELLIGTAIVAILAGIAFLFYGDYVNRARAAAFLVQVDGWREKLAIECATNEAIPTDLQQRVLGFTTPSPLILQDYGLDLFWEGKVSGTGARRFILVSMASASRSATGLRVAPFIRKELDHAGLHYTEYQDVVLPSLQLFAVNLGSCQELNATTINPATLQPPLTPQGPATLQPPAVVPQSPASAPKPGVVIQGTPPLPQGPLAPTAGNPAVGAQGSASAATSGSSTPGNPVLTPKPVTCGANQVLSSDGRSCVASPVQPTQPTSCAGHINPQGRCVGTGNGHKNH